MSNYAMFYNSENGDRVYDADSFSNWLKKFFTTGVFEGDCQVTALGSMVVNLAPGYANIMGKVKELENQTFTLEPADGSYPRIDTIVIERNDTDRDITAKVVTGQLSGNTPAPTPRVWENGVYQLIVAEVYVAAGATEVTQADITDKRSDPDVCGIVAGTVTEMDFSQFTAQFESYFEQFKASNLEEFSEWFEMIRGQLSEDAAGHLQNEIDDINTEIATIVNDLGAKNMLPNNATSQVVAGITYTINSDGSITISGTSTMSTGILLSSNQLLHKGTYKTTTGQTQEEDADAFIYVQDTNTQRVISRSNDLGVPSQFTLANDTLVNYGVWVDVGKTVNVTIYPMVRPASIADDTYAPYAQTNKELTDNLSGFKFYPTGTGIVGLIADDSAYTDADGKYVIWGTATANALVEASPNTYYGRQSEEDLRGEVGADTAVPFSNTKIFDLLPKTITISGYANQTNQETVSGLGIPTMGVYKTCKFQCTAGRVGTNNSYFKKYCLNNGVIEPTTIYIANGSAPTIDISDAIYIDVVATDYNTGRAYNYIFTLSK